jgi:Fic family protein
MRIPTRPPDPNKSFNSLFARKSDLLFKGPGSGEDTAYEHWDRIRFLPPPDGLSAEEHWALIWFTRARLRRTLPFRDKSGGPFTWCEIPRFHKAFHEIDSGARGMIAAPSPHLTGDAGERYLFRSLIEEPYWSSVIEGAATTRAIAKQLIEEKIEPRTRDERMVLNNFHALEFVRANRDARLSPEFLFELHRIVTQSTLDRPDRVGVFRHPQDPVYVVDDATNEVLFQPPPATELPERIRRLCAFANRDPSQSAFVHPIIEAIILHFMLAYDHPFWDGNGRCARALFYWSVLKHGYWLLEYVSISTIIRKAPIQYGRAFLLTETDNSDVTYFIDYHLRVLELAIKELHSYLARRAGEAEELADRLGGLRQEFNHRQIQILTDAAKRPRARYTIAEHERVHSVSYLTARSDLEDLTVRGFLRKSKDGQRSIYRPSPDLSRRLGEKRAARGAKPRA